MQTSRLQDAVKCRPWEQLVKTGEEDMYLRCSAVLGSSFRLPALPGVEDYRSSVCEQLREIGSQTPVTRRFPLKSPGPRTSGRTLGGFGHRTQESIGIQLTEAKRAASKKSVPGQSKSTGTSSTRGRKTRGVPKKPKRSTDGNDQLSEGSCVQSGETEKTVAIEDSSSASDRQFRRARCSESSQE